MLSSWYDWNPVKKDVKLHAIYPFINLNYEKQLIYKWIMNKIDSQSWKESFPHQQCWRVLHTIRSTSIRLLKKINSVNNLQQFNDHMLSSLYYPTESLKLSWQDTWTPSFYSRDPAGLPFSWSVIFPTWSLCKKSSSHFLSFTQLT